MPEIKKTTWGSVGVGAVLHKGNGDNWEVVAVADVHDRGMTPWFRIQSIKTGEMASVPPKEIRSQVEVETMTNSEYAGVVSMVRSTLKAEPIEHVDYTTGAVWHRKVDNMSQIELANHINSHHNSAAPLTMSLDKLGAMHARLHAEAGHGASHNHL